MATIQIADNDARVQYTQAINGIDNDPTPAATELTIDFPFFDLDDINVIKTTAAGVDSVLTRGTGTGTFTVTGTSVDDGFSGGNIKLHDTDADSTVTYTIFRDIAVQRTTDFPTSGPFNISALNTELDRIAAIEQELETKITRTLQLADSDATVDLKLPNLDTRKGKTLAFNETTGQPEAGPTVSGVTTVGDLATDIATLADIEDGTVATNAISGTYAIASDVTTVSGISANVTTVAGNTTNINTVAGNTTNINTVAGNDANVTTVAGISGNVTTVAGISSDVTAVVADATDIGTVASSIADVNSIAAISADVSTVAADGVDIGVVAGISSDVTAVSGIAANVTTVAGNTSNINAVVADEADIGTVATNITNVNTAATNIANINSVAGNSANINAVAADATDIGTVSTNIANVNTVAGVSSNVSAVAGISADVTTVAGISADVTTVASNVSGVNSFADRYRVEASDPVSSLDAGDLVFNTSSSLLKYYDGSAWQGISPGITAVSADANPSLGGDLDVAGNSIVSISNGDIAITPNGTGSVVIDGLNYPQADGSAGQFLKTDGAGNLAFASIVSFDSGTLMLFQQTAAPTGWTKQTTHNDKALRVVSGTASSGGSSAFTTAFATPSVSGTVSLSGEPGVGNLAVTVSGNIADTTLATTQIPSHSHSVQTGTGNVTQNTGRARSQNQISGAFNTGNKGSGGSHNHAHNLSGTMTGAPGVGTLAGSLSSATADVNVQYVDLIIAAKD